MNKLYKITAYHCPRCGGIVNPKSKYCDWCGRELDIIVPSIGVSESQVRILVERDNGYIHLNDLCSATYTEHPIYDNYRTVDGVLHRSIATQSSVALSFYITQRCSETVDEIKNSQIKLRIEQFDKAFELDGYTSNTSMEISAMELAKFNMQFVSDKSINQVPLIPHKIISKIKCPNCGAQLKSRMGACDYCGGWNEVEW